MTAGAVPASDLEAYCPGAQRDLPQTLDLAAHFAWAASDAAASTPGYVERSCLAWAWALRNAGPADTAEAQATLGGALLWAGRGEQAQRLLQDAYPRLVAAQPARSAAAGTAAGLLAAALIQRAELSAALDWSQRALDLVTLPGSGLSPREVLRLQINHLAMLSSARRFDEAQALAAPALAQAQAALPEAAAEYAALLRGQAIRQRRQEKIDAALATTRQEIAFRLSQPGLPASELAVAQQNLGSMLELQGRLDEALTAYSDAMRSAEGGGPDLLRNLSAIPESLSRLLLLRGQSAEALAAAQKAVAMLEGTDLARTARMARPLRQLAQAQLANGAPGEALATLGRARALLEGARGRSDSDTEVAVHTLQVRLLLGLGDTAQAQVALEAASQRLGTLQLAPIEQARLQSLQAAVAQRRGQTAAALQALDRADALLSAGWPASHPLRLALRVQACDWAGRDCAGLQAARGTITEAVLRAQASLALARRAVSAEPASPASGPAPAGRAAAAAAGALVLAAQALSDAQAARQPELLWQAQAAHAQALQAAGRGDAAIFYGKLALQTLQGLRQNVQLLGAGSEALYLQDKHAEYRRVADWLLDAGRLPEALQVMRLLKGSEQSDFIERAGSPPLAELSFTAREQLWLQRLQTGAPALQLPVARAQSGLAVRPVLPLPRDARTLHAYLLAGPDRLSALLVTRKGRRVLHQPVGAAELGSEVLALLDAVRQRRDVRGPAQALHRRLGPLLDEPARAWGVQRIVLWLDGPLRYLPLALLHDGQGFWAERYALGAALPVDAQALPPPLPAVPGSALSVHAWGVTQALAGLPALPGVGDELCAIVDGPMRGLETARCRGVMPGQGDADARFTEAAWRAAGLEAAPGGIVHVGTHFVLRPGNASQSWLLLGDGTRLPMQNLRLWPLGRPRLLTLSACETATPAGTDADGREVDGLAGTLLGSGARQVLASLWRIDDRATGAFMQRFYDHARRRPDDLLQALQQTQRDAIQRGMEPQVWAAFTLIEPAAR